MQRLLLKNNFQLPWGNKIQILLPGSPSSLTGLLAVPIMTFHLPMHLECISSYVQLEESLASFKAKLSCHLPHEAFLDPLTSSHPLPQPPYIWHFLLCTSGYSCCIPPLERTLHQARMVSALPWHLTVAWNWSLNVFSFLGHRRQTKSSSVGQTFSLFGWLTIRTQSWQQIQPMNFVG